MDEFQQLWPLMADHPASTDVYFELLSLLKKHSAIGTNESLGSVPNVLTGATLEYLKCQLILNMYPTVQVLQIMPSILAIDVSWQAVKHMTDVLNHSHDADLIKKLTNLLVHTDWPDKYMQQIEKTVFPVMSRCRAISEDAVSYWTTWVSKSSNEHRNLKRFLDYLNAQHDSYAPLSNEAVFMSATQKVHFLETFIYRDDEISKQDAIPLQTESLVYLIRLVQSLEKSLFCEEILERLLKLEPVFATEGLARVLYLELKRVFVLQSRLYFHLPSLRINTFAKTFNVIDFLCANLALDTVNYFRIEPILRENLHINLELFGPDCSTAQSSELELYDQFTVIRMFRALICGSHDRSKQLELCKRSFCSIETLHGFTNTLECCVALLFLRWDHLTHAELDQTIESGTDTDNQLLPRPAAHTDGEIEARVKHIKYEKQGFVCNVDNLTLILKTLRQAIAKRRDSEDFANHTLDDLQRFERVADIIVDSNWRLTLVRKKDSDTTYRTMVDIKKYMLITDQGHSDQKPKSSSSDDESDTNASGGIDSAVPASDLGANRKWVHRKSGRRNATLPRRKPKNKDPFVKGDSSRQLPFSHSTENERRWSIGIAGVRANSSEESDGQEEVNVCMWSRRRRTEGRKCVMSKMLGSKEHLMTVCMNQGDLKVTRQLIKVHSIMDSALSNELDFTEKCNQTKEKLRQIFVPYRFQTEDRIKENARPTHAIALDPKTTVDRIQKVAAYGFDSSKITNIIATFSKDNTVHLPNPDDVDNALSKFSSKYHFLKQFQPQHSLQATIICDLAISLAPNHEIAFNMLNVLTKLWATSVDSSHTSVIGYLPFFQNMVESVRTLAGNGYEALGIMSFLSDTILPANTKTLLTALHRKETLRKLNETLPSEYATPDALQLHAPSFAALLRLPSATNVFNRVVHFVFNVLKLLQLAELEPKANSLHDLLQLDLRTSIGTMIFDKGISPTDLEAHTCNINLNLVYEIALNLAAPVHSVPPDSDKISIEQLLQNVENQKDAVGNGQVAHRPIGGAFMCQNAMVFDYVSKHSSMLGYLLQNLVNQRAKTGRVDLFGCEMNFIENMMDLEQIDVLSTMYERSTLWTALSFDCITEEMVASFLEHTHDEHTALKAILTIKCQHRLRNRAATNHLQTWLIERILAKSKDHSYMFTWIEHISDPNTRAKCLLENMLSIRDFSTCVRLIRSTLLVKTPGSLHNELHAQLNQWLHDINVYAQIAKIFNACRSHNRIYRWRDILHLSSSKPEQILENILTNSLDCSLCLQWADMHPLADNTEKIEQIIQIFVGTVKQLQDIKPELFQLIETLPKAHVVDMYIDLIQTVKNVSVLRYLLDYLQPTDGPMVQRLVHKINISVTMFETSDDSTIPWHLVASPILIIEQYLMNSRFDALAKIIRGVKGVLATAPCAYCAEHQGDVFRPGAILDVTSKTFSDSVCDEYVLFHQEFSLLEQQHNINVSCVDSLLRIYASKALDFRVIESHTSSDDLHSPSTTDSMDTLQWNTFIMPREAPTRANWIRDDEATHCMSCRRAVFTMLTRRHHCRQCGRVVCHACSTKRALIPSLYADVRVRICDDCDRQLELDRTKTGPSSGSNTADSGSPMEASKDEAEEWTFSGNVRHDDLLREEFSYEFAPSVSLCLSILALHSTTGPECANFLLLHCRKFESLLRPLQPGVPNPEIDYAMVTRMLHCLALAAKVRGGPPECDVVLEHAEIIRSLVLHRCETLLPMESLNQSCEQLAKVFRKLRDALVLAEKWNLALEVSLKQGFPTTGVMAAWGIACLRAGSFETAREKFNHCLTKVSTEDDIFKVFTDISYESTFQINKPVELACIKRPPKSPPLLAEIVHILEMTSHPMQPAVMDRASVIQASYASLSSASNRSKRLSSDEANEPALSILHTLSNLKQIAAGVQEATTTKSSDKRRSNTISARMSPNSRFYDECLYYLTAYANHNDILMFLVKHLQIRSTLKYVHYQNVDADIFVRALFMPYLRKGQAAQLVQLMIELDDTLLIWKPYIIPLCAHLERNGLLNCLYLLQMLFKDPIRASMTCIRFYEKNCCTYSDLLAQSFHLVDAEMHLTKELDMCQWQEIGKDGRGAQRESKPLLMRMDSRTLNGHINTIARQLEATKFLANCEQANRHPLSLLTKMFMQSSPLPTLFGTTKDKIHLTILVLVCGLNITDGYGLAYRIINDCQLDAESVYTEVVKHLARDRKLHGVVQLIECIRGNSVGIAPNDRLCDRIIGVGVEEFCSEGFEFNADVALRELFDRLLKQVTDVAVQISCYIAGGQLKSAYLLAVQHEREADIRKVLCKAEKTNQTQIRKLCERKLNIQPN